MQRAFPFGSQSVRRPRLDQQVRRAIIASLLAYASLSSGTASNANFPEGLPADENAPAAPTSAFDVHTLRRVVEPVVRDALGPVHTLLAQLLVTRSSSANEAGAMHAGDQTMHVRLTQTALQDAHARVRCLEEDNGRLGRELV